MIMCWSDCMYNDDYDDDVCWSAWIIMIIMCFLYIDDVLVRLGNDDNDDDHVLV